MKCESCGAELDEFSTECSYCGTKISVEDLKESEQLRKKACPSCRSTNVSYHRETQGEVKGKNGTSIVRATVGVCADCGYTWNTSEPEKKKTPTWVWVLGWIFIFPLPLTFLMLRKKEMKPALKYGIIVAVWICYFAWVYFGGDTTNSNVASTGTETAVVKETTEVSSASAFMIDEMPVIDGINIEIIGINTCKDNRI